jgi:hypothetical protein
MENYFFLGKLSIREYFSTEERIFRYRVEKQTRCEVINHFIMILQTLTLDKTKDYSNIAFTIVRKSSG